MKGNFDNMYNKKKCRKCKYSSYIGGGHKKYTSDLKITCNYSMITDQTCLFRKNGKIVDRRGNDPENCKLFDDGNKIRRRVEPNAKGA